MLDFQAQLHTREGSGSSPVFFAKKLLISLEIRSFLALIYASILLSLFPLFNFWEWKYRKDGIPSPAGLRIRGVCAMMIISYRDLNIDIGYIFSV